MLILMTGATGFIGENLAGRLTREGHQVRALTRPTSDTRRLAAMGVDIRAGDPADASFLEECLKNCDIIVNAAGRLGKWGVSDEDLRPANVGLVRRLLEAVQNDSVRQFIHFSTPGVVGMVGVAPECMPPRPSGPYERTKLEAERLVRAYHKNGAVPVTILRPDFVYGPGDLHKLRMFKAIQQQRFPIIGRGTSLLHPTYVDDVAQGTMLVLANPDAFGQTFNLAGPSVVTVATLVKEIAGLLNVKVTRLAVPVPVLKMGAFVFEKACRAAGKEPPVTRQQIRFFTHNHASDISKAQGMLGYSPSVSLSEGMSRTVSWYKREGYL